MPAVLTGPCVFGEVEQSIFDRLEPDRPSESEAEYGERANAQLDRLVDDIYALTPFWEKVSASARKWGADELHSLRDKVELVWRAKASLLADVELIGNRIVRATGQTPRAWSNLEQSRKLIAEFESNILNRWQSLDDLEEILLGPMQLSQEQCIELAKRFPPPQSWYEEDFDPFTPEEPSP